MVRGPSLQEAQREQERGMKRGGGAKQGAPQRVQPLGKPAAGAASAGASGVVPSTRPMFGIGSGVKKEQPPAAKEKEKSPAGKQAQQRVEQAVFDGDQLWWGRGLDPGATGWVEDARRFLQQPIQRPIPTTIGGMNSAVAHAWSVLRSFPGAPAVFVGEPGLGPWTMMLHGPLTGQEPIFETIEWACDKGVRILVCAACGHIGFGTPSWKGGCALNEALEQGLESGDIDSKTFEGDWRLLLFKARRKKQRRKQRCW